MRIALVYERRADLLCGASDSVRANAELLTEFEENDLLAGLRDAGHEVERIGDAAALLDWCREQRPGSCDLVFNLSVGYRGLDRLSSAPAVLELAGLPYSGSGPYAKELGRNKYDAKQIVAAAGVATAPGRLWRGRGRAPDLDSLRYPVIVKPVAESSSAGVEAEASVLSTPEAAAARAAWIVERFGQPALIETFVRGGEVEVPLLGWPELEVLGVAAVARGGRALAGDAILSGEAIFDEDYGYVEPGPEVDVEAVSAAARSAAEALHLRDYGRVDFRVAEDGTPYFMDAAGTPDLSRRSSFAFVARARGQSHSEMLDAIVKVAVQRQSSQNSLSHKYQGSR